MTCGKTRADIQSELRRQSIGGVSLIPSDLIESSRDTRLALFEPRLPLEPAGMVGGDAVALTVLDFLPPDISVWAGSDLLPSD